MESQERRIDKALENASEGYSKQVELRAAVQLIPWVGGALDTLMSGKGFRIQQQRIEEFLKNLNSRLTKIEDKQDQEASEEFFDLVLSVFDGVARTRSKEKRSRFASIIANKIANDAPWEEAETIARLLKELDDIHIKVLSTAVRAPVCDAPFDNLCVVTLREAPYGEADKECPIKLTSELPEHPVEILRMICSELTARGLLYDEGLGRFDTKALEFFVATDLAKVFLSWISESQILE